MTSTEVPARWYRTRKMSLNIEPVLVTNITAKYALVHYRHRNTTQGVREAITSNYSCLFPTWREAQQHLIARCEAEYRFYEAALAKETLNLEKLRALSHPVEE